MPPSAGQHDGGVHDAHAGYTMTLKRMRPIFTRQVPALVVIEGERRTCAFVTTRAGIREYAPGLPISPDNPLAETAPLPKPRVDHEPGQGRSHHAPGNSRPPSRRRWRSWSPVMVCNSSSVGDAGCRPEAIWADVAHGGGGRSWGFRDVRSDRGMAAEATRRRKSPCRRGK